MAQIHKEVRITVDDILQSVEFNCSKCLALVIINVKEVGMDKMVFCPKCGTPESRELIFADVEFFSRLKTLARSIPFRVRIE